MITSRDILFKGRFIIEKEIAAEARAQGHYLTGNLERSMTATVTGDIVQGEIAGYASILNKGFPAGSASMRQFPFLVKFWMLKGLDLKTAKGAAAATIRKWQKFGMPTASSFSFSRNGYREGLLDRALAKAMPKANEAIAKAVDQEIQKLFNQTKSGVV